MNPFRQHLDQTAKSMKDFGEFLIPYNFPLNPRVEDEDDLSVLKTREACVDGYSVILYYNKSDFSYFSGVGSIQHFVETVQVQGRHFPFLPFALVCKVGKAFFGNEHLALAEAIRENRKLYCWTLMRDKDGKPVPNPLSENIRTFEGFEYNYLSESAVTFY